MPTLLSIFCVSKLSFFGLLGHLCLSSTLIIFTEEQDGLAWLACLLVPGGGTPLYKLYNLCVAQRVWF